MLQNWRAQQGAGGVSVAPGAVAGQGEGEGGLRHAEEYLRHSRPGSQHRLIQFFLLVCV